MPWNKTPLASDWIKFDLGIIRLKFLYIEKIKKPKDTKKNLKANAEKGSLLSTIGLVVIKADDHKTINIKGKIFVIYKKLISKKDLEQL